MSPQATTRPPATNQASFSIKRALIHMALVLQSLLGAYPIPAQSHPSEGDIKAAYLYNFGKFVNWPTPSEATSEPFTICIVGKDNFGPVLDSLIANETIQGRKIIARRIPSIAGADTCQLVFLGESEDSRLNADLEALNGKPVLTVSNLPRFVERGGMIQFLSKDNRIRFAVNLTSAEHAHLTLSSELLKVAVFVNSTPGEDAR